MIYRKKIEKNIINKIQKKSDYSFACFIDICKDISIINNKCKYCVGKYNGSRKCLKIDYCVNGIYEYILKEE